VGRGCPVTGDPEDDVRWVLFTASSLAPVVAEAIESRADLLVTTIRLFLLPERFRGERAVNTHVAEAPS
jgi:hypothetical protein